MKLQNAVLALILGLSPSFAWAITNLKQVEVVEGSKVELSFDGKILPGQIKTEFFNDIIQLTLTDVSVYPARIFSVNAGDVTKIFAYQYGPKVVRCRISVKGKADNYKNRIQTIQNGKQFALKIKAGADEIRSVSAKPVTQPVVEDVAEEKALLERIIKAENNTPVVEKVEKAEKIEKSEKISEKIIAEKISDKAMAAVAVASTAQEPVVGRPQAKPLAGFTRTFIALLGVIAIFGGLVFGVRWLMKNSKSNNKILSAISNQMAKAGISSKKQKMIEVVATHHLGPKKSIAMVRIGGKTLVLGVGQDAINLITTLGSDGESEGPIADLFESNLDQAVTQSVIQSVAPQAPSAPNSVRAQIRSRLEGLKQL